MNFKPMFLSFLFSKRRRKRGSRSISWIFFLERGRERVKLLPTVFSIRIRVFLNIIIKRVNSDQIRVRQVNTNMTHLLNVLGGSTQI